MYLTDRLPSSTYTQDSILSNERKSMRFKFLQHIGLQSKIKTTLTTSKGEKLTSILEPRSKEHSNLLTKKSNQKPTKLKSKETEISKLHFV